MKKEKKKEDAGELFTETDEIGDGFSQTETEQNGGSVFENTASSDNPLFAEDPPVVSTGKNPKKKKIIILCAVFALIIALICAAAFALPSVMLRRGDEYMKNGRCENAVTCYRLCFGLNNSQNRLKTAKASVLIGNGETENGIKALLRDGITVNIQYDLNGGSFINSSRNTSVSLTEESQFGDLYKARKDYYTFDNWSVLRYKYAPDFDDSAVDLELKANFSLTQYKISYTGLFSDTTENPTEYNYESDAVTLKNPTRRGYTFLYWKGTDIDGQSATVIIPKGSHGDRSYIANWEANRYTVTLNPDVECEIENPITVTFNDAYSLPAIEKRGYTHTGWTDGNETYFDGVWTTVTDVSVTPVWKINQYSLQYHTDGGSFDVSNPDTYTVLSDDITLSEPTKFGYTFQGWLYSDRTVPEKNVVIPTDSIGDMDFTAVWKGNPHILSLNANGGAVNPAALNVVFGSPYTLPTPNRVGYTFTGWHDGNKKVTDGTWDRDSDVKLNAEWTANRYKISFNANGGSIPNNSLTVTYDSAYSLPSPTRYGYTFTGWYSGNTRYNSSGTWNAVSDLTLTAAWQGNSHSVSLNANGGALSASSVNVTVGSRYSLPTPSKKGYTFAGWYNGSSKFSESGTWDRDENVSLSASWNVNTYEAKLNANGGIAGRSSVSCRYEDSYSLPTPTRSGYTFRGWFLGSSQIQNNGKWTWDQNLDLTASWAANRYTVNLDANGGSVGVSQVSVTYDSSYTLPTPKKKGYSFNGWYSGSSRFTDGIWKSDRDVSLTAQWKVNTYKAVLDANGGEINSSSAKYEYGSRFSLPTPTQNGYKFLGWYTDSGDKCDSGTWSWDENMRFTARWEPYRYTVTLSANGGDVAPSSMTVTFGKSYSLPIPEKTGYDFFGWYKGSVSFASSGKWSYAGDIELTAQWRLKKYTVHLDVNGGRVSASSYSYEFNSRYSLPTPTRPGYTFDGWYDGEAYFNDSGVWKWDTDMWLKAKWRAEEYTVLLDANGGSVSPRKKTVEYGASYSLPTPEKADCTFIGWYNGNSSFPSDGKWSYAGDIELTAKWEKTSVVTLDANGGDLPSGRTLRFNYGTAYSLPMPSRTGYIFNGWHADGRKLSQSGTWEYRDDVTLVADWYPITTTVVLDPGLNGNVSPDRMQIQYGDRYSLPTPTWDGQTFEGWFYGDTYISESGTWRIEDFSVTLTAHWSAA